MRRRDFLWSGPALLAATAIGQAAPIPAVALYERSSGGHVGFFAENVTSGAKLAWRADERFIMCSTFKASLVALVLTRVDHGREDLKAPVFYGEKNLRDVYGPVARANLARGALSVGAMCKAAIEVSDGVCANLLLARVGGPPALTSFWRSIGDHVSRVDHYEPFLDRAPSGGPLDATSPSAMAGTLRKLVLGDVLSKQSRKRFTDWLIGSQTGGNRLRAGLPKNWVTGDKTGHSGKDVAGDIAITWTSSHAPIVISAYTRGGWPTAEQFDAVFRGVGRFVAATLGS